MFSLIGRSQYVYIHVKMLVGIVKHVERRTGTGEYWVMRKARMQAMDTRELLDERKV